MPMWKTPGTLEQLPRNAETYVRESLHSDVYTYQRVGKDEIGRTVYQRYFDGDPVGEPRALLSFREFRQDVKAWAVRVSSIGINRWTAPYGAVK